MTYLVCFLLLIFILNTPSPFFFGLSKTFFASFTSLRAYTGTGKTFIIEWWISMYMYNVPIVQFYSSKLFLQKFNFACIFPFSFNRYISAKWNLLGTDHVNWRKLCKKIFKFPICVYNNFNRFSVKKPAYFYSIFGNFSFKNLLIILG